MDIEKVISEVELIIKKYKSGEIVATDVIQEISKTFPKKTRGAKKRDDVTERKLDITRRILKNEMEREVGISSTNKTSFISDLVLKIEEEYGIKYSEPDLFKIYEKHKIDVMSDWIKSKLDNHFD
jgi:Na+-transporting NADH:ubiquinone oxidoreductase subunit NqrF